MESLTTPKIIIHSCLHILKYTCFSQLRQYSITRLKAHTTHTDYTQLLPIAECTVPKRPHKYRLYNIISVYSILCSKYLVELMWVFCIDRYLY